MTEAIDATVRFHYPQAHVGLLCLTRPDVANAINTAMARELLHFFAERVGGERELRCVILTGAGSRAFCAGGDLKERDGMSDAEWSAQHVIVERMILAMLNCQVPIIAAVNGAAFGGGCELALAADFIFAAESASFALPETALGIIPGAGGTITLPRAVGIPRAMELICTASHFTAAQALEWGMVNRIVADDALQGAALATAARIAMNAPLAVKGAKKCVRRSMQLDLPRALQVALETYYPLIGTEDRREGARSFVERRKPKFEGR